MSASARLDFLGQRPEQVPGTLLLTGADSSHLRKHALGLAARLLCPGDDQQMICGSCRRVFNGLHPDLLLIEPEGVQIRIDRIREALAFGAGRPYESGRRVVIVSRAEQLGLEASNALLKSLEEPGACFRWILTTSQPESLLTTILSRCAVLPIAPPSVAERRALWRQRGYSADDSEDLSLFEPQPESATEELVSYRRARAEISSAFEEGFLRRKLPVLLLLADRAARTQETESRLIAELLADTALSTVTSAEFLRHRAVAGTTRQLGFRLPNALLRRAAALAADAPADTRRGNRRLHFEKVLLELYLATEDLERGT